MAIPVLVGVTASGKTALLVRLRERHDIQVISADSRQVYRGMDIGTAKPSAEEMERLPHHLVDIVDPDSEFSAGDFAGRAVRLAHAIIGEGSVPVVCGGTALYVMALTGGLDPMPGRCPGVREGLGTLEDENPGFLMELLRRADPVSAGRIGVRDRRRQVRALELLFLTGRPASSLRRGGDPTRRELYSITGIDLPDDILRSRIVERTSRMIREGLVEEVRGLLDEGYGRESALGRTIGYREVLDCLDGEIDGEDQLMKAIETSTWHLVRRQRNMFRRIPGITWISGEDTVGAESLLFREGGL